MKKKIIWGVIVVVLIIAGISIYHDLSQSFCGPDCSVVTDENSNYVKQGSIDVQKTNNIPEKIATPDNSNTGAMFLVKKNEWGISFPLPNGWNVTNDVDSQVVLTQSSTGDRITLDYTVSNSYTDIDAKIGEITYTFNDVSRKWISIENNTYSDNREVSNEAKPVFMIQNTIPVFPGTSRWKTYIIPLSDTQFLKVNITGSGQVAPLDEFIKTIIIYG